MTQSQSQSDFLLRLIAREAGIPLSAARKVKALFDRLWLRQLRTFGELRLPMGVLRFALLPHKRTFQKALTFDPDPAAWADLLRNGTIRIPPETQQRLRRLPTTQAHSKRHLWYTGPLAVVIETEDGGTPQTFDQILNAEWASAAKAAEAAGIEAGLRKVMFNLGKE